MKWIFQLIDRIGTLTEVKNPVGWEAVDLKLKRDLVKHGVFIDYSDIDFRFHGNGAQLIKSEKEAYGLEGYMLLRITLDCEGTLIALPDYRLLFAKYSYECGDVCFAVISATTTSDVMDLEKRFDQKVDLDSLLAFDGATALPPYDALNFNLTLPSKGIYLQDKAINEIPVSEKFLGQIQYATQPGNLVMAGEYAQISVPCVKQIAGEIGSFDPPPAPFYEFVAGAYGSSDPTSLTPNRIKVQGLQGYTWEWPLNANPIINFYSGSRNFGAIDTVGELKNRMKFTIKSISCTIMILRMFMLRLPDGKSGESWNDYQVLDVQTLFSTGNVSNTTNNPNTGIVQGIMPGQQQSFDASYNNAAFKLNDGDRIIWYLSTYAYRSVSQINNALSNGTKAFEITFDTETFFSFSALSHTAPTPAKVYMPNEAFSRVAEAITNGAIQAYSNYFGRTDSQPYAHTGDGCGALQPITNGIRIRQQENRVAGQTLPFSISLQDLWQGFNPIHHIGMGPEADPQRPGFNRLRIEPWRYFYDDTVVLSLTGVTNLVEDVNAEEHYSQFTAGYEKYETEEYNGLDEFLTKRTYRTTQSQVQNLLPQLSKWIASGYAIEITRRKQSESSDWRYDNDGFVICVKRLSTSGYSFNAYYQPGNDFEIYPLDAVEQANASNLFVVGAVITISNSVNNGTYTITAVTNIGGSFGSLRITVSTPFANASLGPDTFTAGGSNAGGYIVELGNITSPVNIIEPSTVYNYRISPERNAMRWMDEVFRTYRNQNNAVVKFTDGTGNYLAAGEQESTTCKIENQSIAENKDIDISLFADPLKAKPFLRPERVTFEKKLSIADFILLRANPRGLVHYENSCANGDGWIDEINYKPENGTAAFSLIPKFV